MLTSTQMATDAGAELDPNLQLQQQRNLALPADSTTLPPPPPPPMNAPTSTSGTSTNDQAGATAAQPSFSATGTTANDTTPTAPATPQTGVSSTPPPPAGLALNDANGTSVLNPPVLRTGDAPPPPPPLPLSDPGAGATGGLPSGFTMGDPKGADYGASYYNGQKVQGTTYGPDGKMHWALADGSVGPLYDQGVADQISGAANKAYSDTYLDRAIASSTNPAMQAVMSDPQWRSLQGQQLNWDQLSPDLQAKIAKVPALYASLHGQTDLSQYAAPAAPASTAPANYLQNGLNTYADGTPVAGGYNALSDLYRQLGVTPGVVNQQVIDLVKQNPALVSTLPPDQAKTLTATLQSMGITVPQTAAKFSPSGSGSDTGTPSSSVGSSVPLGSGSTTPKFPTFPTYPGTGGSSTGGLSTGGSSAAGGSYTPGDVAIGNSVLPNADPRLTNLRSLLDNATGQLGSVDRVQLAKDTFDQLYNSTDPQYQQDLRSAKQYAYGNGMGGSAGERDLYRNTFTTRQSQLDNAKKGIINDAVQGSIGDQFNKVSALSGLEGQQYGEGANTRNELRTERGYQGSLEQQSFDRALEQYRQQQQDVADRFSRGVTLTQLGSQGNPSDYLAQLAQQYGVDPSVIAALAAQQGQRSIPAPPSH